MSSWVIEYSEAALKDLKSLDGSQQILVKKAIRKVSQNPVSEQEGGLGKPLGNHNNSDLVGCYKIKLRKAGIRVVYRLKIVDNKMRIIIIGMREDVYTEAKKRLSKGE